MSEPPLHLIKLSVGSRSVESLRRWQAGRRKALRGKLYHVTRMAPKRAEELLAGGSIYWVLQGSVQCRQRLADIEPYIDRTGIRRCRLHLQPEIVETMWQPRRPFQGWRYLLPKDAPEDCAPGDDPTLSALREELAALGLR